MISCDRFKIIIHYPITVTNYATKGSHYDNVQRLKRFAIIITTERYTNGKTNLTLPSENLRLYSSSLPTEFTSKSAASSVLFPSLQDQRKKCKKSVRSFKCDIGSQKNKIINFANKLHLGEANKQGKKKHCYKQLYIEWHAS